MAVRAEQEPIYVSREMFDGLEEDAIHLISVGQLVSDIVQHLIHNQDVTLLGFSTADDSEMVSFKIINCDECLTPHIHYESDVVFDALADRFVEVDGDFKEAVLSRKRIAFTREIEPISHPKVIVINPHRPSAEREVRA